ncbi:glycoside hydrolase family 99-like domain-containing protein [Planctomicrobium piriforme]|uniref:Glycosyltransferase WbsX n=1 Tax=Planctomicrobium piriforme TaxID=1576369 RepID=A0A1I3E6F1_9PLAN|nr:glycoside hydrolase family 99-like domain-containing protein [Planctomicrobium piriforme]SFH94535.1 Glycosyltransferase WbsX [Planctomicrobium piriforme]
MKTTVSLLLFVLLGGTAFAQGSSVKPTVGAIRWDAWTGGQITEEVKKSLGPKKYHLRLPWFAEVIDDDTVQIDGSPQEVMDRELEYAANAGLDYWAFLTYPENGPMSFAMKQYLQSSKRHLLHFCVILHYTLSNDVEKWPRELERSVALLQEPGYQTVLDGRPLVYVFISGTFPYDRFNQFLDAAKSKGLNPYCVFMGGEPSTAYKEVSGRGFDAVSAYAQDSNQAKFSDLTKAVEKDRWQNAARSKTPYVPLVTTGWEKRPRQDHPVSWEVGQAYLKQKVFPSRATPPEISSHLRRAIAFVRENPEVCPARTIIIYAWNEYDEGGWLAPTRSADGTPDTGRLDAIQKVLK